MLLSYAMKRVGDVGELRKRRGALAVMGACWHAHLRARCAGDGGRVLQPALWTFVGKSQPGRARSASLTFVANALAARIFLHERVGRRRWIAALLVAAGVALMAI